MIETGDNPAGEEPDPKILCSLKKLKRAITELKSETSECMV
jgi:hypothetical protein